MSKNSDYITILCGVFEDSSSPLTRAEFWKLYHECGDSVENVINSNDERVDKLLERSGSVVFALDKLREMGVRIQTFIDDGFPEKVFGILKDFCPPVLYMCGDSELFNLRYAGYVGSREIDENDVKWTEMMVQKNLSGGFGIVSGGAKGIDRISINYALSKGGHVIAYLPDNMNAWIRDNDYRSFVMDGKLLLCSPVSPFAKKTKNSFVAAAMERNKLIYAQSLGTAVVKSDLKKGGTWSGAYEAIKHDWSPVYVWDNKSYPGNQGLIELGGIPISNEGKALGTYSRKTTNEVQPEENNAEKYTQMDLSVYLNELQTNPSAN